MTAMMFFSVGRGTGPTTVAPARVTVSTIFFGRNVKTCVVVGLQSDTDFLSRHDYLFLLTRTRLSFLRFEGKPVLSDRFAHTTIFLSTHFEVPGHCPHHRIAPVEGFYR